MNFRRSIRVFDENKPLDSEKVKKCIELATLSPSSSNMQLWDFYHVTDKTLLQQLGKMCFGQKAGKTAQQLVVIVTRRDLYKKRAAAVLEREIENVKKNSPKERLEKRLKDRKEYYGRTMPFLYAYFFGLLGLVRKIIVSVMGLSRPVYREVGEGDMRVTAHKSVGLAAQTFMLAMAEQGYDTCPMEGFDSIRTRKLMKLPRKAEINMIIACGIRKGTEGIYGDRHRVPFEQVYTRI